MKLLIAFILVLLLVSSALAGTGNIYVWKSGNGSTIVRTDGVNHTPIWASYTDANNSFRVNVTNVSDTLTFTMYNFTIGRVYELKGNNTVSSINGIKANSTGALNFTFTQSFIGNTSYSLKPAVTVGGYNTTFLYTDYFYHTPTFTNVSSSRAENTVYYNGNDTPIDVVAMLVTGAAGDQCELVVGTTAPPTQRRAHFALASVWTTIYMTVPPYNYYQLVRTGTQCYTPAIGGWYELYN